MQHSKIDFKQVSQSLKRDIKKRLRIKKVCLFSLFTTTLYHRSNKNRSFSPPRFWLLYPLLPANKQRKGDSTSQGGGMKIPGDVSPRVRKELTTYFRNNINQHLSQDCRFAVSRENQVRPWKTINKGLGSWRVYLFHGAEVRRTPRGGGVE